MRITLNMGLRRSVGGQTFVLTLHLLSHTVCVSCLHSPHIAFLSQSVLAGPKHLCGARLCHEIAHAWFGLAIGARDWTEEWISEGFATFLEDVLWAKVQQVTVHPLASSDTKQAYRAILMTSDYCFWSFQKELTLSNTYKFTVLHNKRCKHCFFFVFYCKPLCSDTLKQVFYHTCLQSLVFCKDLH